MAKAVALESLPSIQLLEDITRESAARVIQQLSAFKGSRVALEIFSNGGDVHGSQAVAAYISNPANGLQVEARIYGNAASGAMIIAAACQKAYIAEGAFALIHKAHAVGQDGKVIPHSELPKAEQNVIDAMNADQVDLFKKRTGKTAAQIEKLMEQDRDMPAEEAVDFGLFDGLIPQAAKLAAYKNINTMSEQKKTITVQVKASAALAAIASGTIEVPADQIAEAQNAEAETLKKSVEAKDAEIADLKAKLEASEKSKTDAEAVTAAEVSAKTAAEAELKAAREAVGKYQATIEALKKNPLVAQTLPDGTQVVIPGGEEKKTVELTAKESHFSRTQLALAEYDKRKQAAK